MSTGDSYGGGIIISSSSGVVSGGGGGTGLCEALGLMPACANALWTVKSLHPPWHVHQLLADLLALTLGREHAESCRKAKQQQQQVGLSSWLSLGPNTAAEATTHTTPSSSSSRRHAARTVPPLFGGSSSSSRGSSSSGGNGGLGESSEQACGAPLTVMSTLRTMAMLRVVHPLGDHQGWSLEEDVPVIVSTTDVITSKPKKYTLPPRSFFLEAS